MSTTANRNSSSSETIASFGQNPVLVVRAGDASVPTETVKFEKSSFADRRSADANLGNSERRQFGSSHAELSPDARELAVAIDRYKLEYRRRYITCEEMLTVVKSLGYQR